MDQGHMQTPKVDLKMMDLLNLPNNMMETFQPTVDLALDLYDGPSSSENDDDQGQGEPSGKHYMVDIPGAALSGGGDDLAPAEDPGILAPLSPLLDKAQGPATTTITNFSFGSTDVRTRRETMMCPRDEVRL